MGSVTVKSDGAVIVYDADLFGKIEAAFFDPGYWRDRGALTGQALGRGTAWFIRHGDLDLVLRHYRRGGFLGPWLVDRYLWLGLDATRAMREWRLLQTLYRGGLPVPRPAAARVRQHGLYYRADLITQRIPQAESVAQWLTRAPVATESWQAIGACLRRFHRAGVCHADLNAHNILLAGNDIYIVDFDRGQIRAPGAWTERNLARLRRSLAKLTRQHAGFRFADADWAALRVGYDEAARGPREAGRIAEGASLLRPGD